MQFVDPLVCRQDGLFLLFFLELNVPQTTGSIDDSWEVSRVHCIQYIKEESSVRFDLLKIPLWEVCSNLLIILHQFNHFLHAKFVQFRHNYVVDFVDLERPLVVLKQLLPEVFIELCWGRQIIL